MTTHPLRRTFPRAVLLSVLALAALGCGADTDDHGHDHDAEPLAVTVHADGYEIYVEHDAPVVGRPAPFIIQVTDSVTGGPADSGPALLSLRDADGDGGSLRTDEPVHPGTWEPTPTFPSAGTWTLGVELPGLGLDVALGTVQVFADAHAADHAPHSAHADGIRMDKERQWLLGVRTEPAAMDAFTHVVRVSATVTAPPDRRAEVATPVAGALAATGGGLPTPGTPVRAGEVLAEIRPSFSGAVEAAGAWSDLARAESELDLTRAELDRASALAVDGAASARRLEEAGAAVRRAESVAAAARSAVAALRAAGLDPDAGTVRLTSPIDGVVTDIHAGLGELVPEGGPVFTVLDPTIVWLRGMVPEAEAPMLSPAPDAAYRLPGSVADPTPVGARDGEGLIFLGAEVDHDSRTVPITYAVINDGGLRVGTTMDLFVHTLRSERGPVLPEEAVVDDDGRSAVFVQLDGTTFEKRLVTVAGRDGGRVLISEGLAPGERVVTASAYSVLLAAAGTSVPAHGHTH